MIEKDYDVSFVAAIALREKQIQQNYRPVIAELLSRVVYGELRRRLVLLEAHP